MPLTISSSLDVNTVPEETLIMWCPSEISLSLLLLKSNWVLRLLNLWMRKALISFRNNNAAGSFCLIRWKKKLFTVVLGVLHARLTSRSNSQLVRSEWSDLWRQKLQGNRQILPKTELSQTFWLWVLSKIHQKWESFCWCQWAQGQSLLASCSVCSPCGCLEAGKSSVALCCARLRAFCRLFGALGLDRRDAEQNREYLMSSSRSAESPGFGQNPSQTCCFEVERWVHVYTLLWFPTSSP